MRLTLRTWCAGSGDNHTEPPQDRRRSDAHRTQVYPHWLRDKTEIPAMRFADEVPRNTQGQRSFGFMLCGFVGRADHIRAGMVCLSSFPWHPPLDPNVIPRLTRDPYPRNSNR